MKMTILVAVVALLLGLTSCAATLRAANDQQAECPYGAPAPTGPLVPVTVDLQNEYAETIFRVRYVATGPGGACVSGLVADSIPVDAASRFASIISAPAGAQLILQTSTKSAGRWREFGPHVHEVGDSSSTVSLMYDYDSANMRLRLRAR